MSALGSVQLGPARWITFEPAPVPAKYKTSAWRVKSRVDGGVLGTVCWFARWRKYSFFAAIDTVFEPDCLRDIATFLEQETAKQRESARRRRESA